MNKIVKVKTCWSMFNFLRSLFSEICEYEFVYLNVSTWAPLVLRIKTSLIHIPSMIILIWKIQEKFLVCLELCQTYDWIFNMKNSVLLSIIFIGHSLKSCNGSSSAIRALVRAKKYFKANRGLQPRGQNTIFNSSVLFSSHNVNPSTRHPDLKSKYFNYCAQGFKNFTWSFAAFISN